MFFFFTNPFVQLIPYFSRLMWLNTHTQSLRHLLNKHIMFDLFMQFTQQCANCVTIDLSDKKNTYCICLHTIYR